MEVTSLKNNGYDIFISYRHETGFYMAQVIYEKFTAGGYNIFMDKTLDSGRYEEKIHEAIVNCKNFIQVLFPKDISECKKADSWLSKEAAWALENEKTNIIPVMCDGFSWPENPDGLSEAMNGVKGNNGIFIHKDITFDKNMDILEGFLKNVSPDKSEIDETEFFKFNLEQRNDLSVTGVDMAFHAGVPWFITGDKKDMMTASFNKNIRWRILINTVDAAESIAKNMRDKEALYVSFRDAHEHWKKMVSLYPDSLEVRECDIPLIRVYHSVRFIDKNNNHSAESHIKYYAYNNLRLDKAFSHKINSSSKYYSVYSNEFEFLWNQSKKI